jgi:hypothetical protein
MFDQYFYHEKTRKTVSLFGSLFNNIYVIRTNSDNQVLSQVKVPLSYAPRRKFLERIAAMNDEEELERQIAIKLPRMSFEIVAFSRDDQRMLRSTNTVCGPGTSGSNKMRFYTGVPYILNFQMNIYSKNQDDALQVVEQILPYFKPQYNITIKPIDGYDSFKEDIPITLQGVTFLDDYEGAVEQRRTIIYTLDFELKTTFYGPTDGISSIIRQVDGQIVDFEGNSIETLRITPDPINVSPDSDYGFNTEIIPGWDSA